jgi:Ubiquitin-specific protease C-terminal
MSAKVGEFLKRDPIKIRFTTTQPSNAAPKSVLKRQLNPSIQEIMSPSYVSPQSTIILYELLDVSIVELETKRSLKIVWTGILNREEASYSFLLPKTNSVNELSENLAKQVTLIPEGSSKIRIFEISKDGKSQKEFTGSEMIGNIPEVDLFAEVRLFYFSSCNTCDFLIPNSRKFLSMNFKLMRQIKSSMSFTSIVKYHELMGFRLNLSSNQYVSRNCKRCK